MYSQVNTTLKQNKADHALIFYSWIKNPTTCMFFDPVYFDVGGNIFNRFRKQTTIVDSTSSASQNTSGVRQGSMLEPFLTLLFFIA
jgi:hypothetical protein